jgi:hypothetical protein
MFPGFDKLVEERIRRAQLRGDFDKLSGSGKPLNLCDDANIPEDLRLAYKILKNADMIPPEIELKKEILRTEDLLQGMSDEAEKYHTIKKLNFLIMKLNNMRTGSIEFDVPQYYADRLIDRLEATNRRPAPKT